MSERRGVRYRLGLVCIGLGIISPVFALFVPWLGLSKGAAAAVVAGLLVGGPELFLILGAALAGKEAVEAIKGWFKALLRQTAPSRPVSRARYQLGLFLFVGAGATNWLLAYVTQAVDLGLAASTILSLMVILDVITVGSFLILGGQFWQKLERLFTWEAESG